MAFRYISGLCVTLANSLKATDTTAVITTETALRLNQMEIGDYTFLTFNYNGVTEEVKYTHTKVIEPTPKKTSIAIERDLDGVGAKPFPIRTCACNELTARTALELFKELISKKQDKVKKCDGADMPGGTQLPTCAELTQALGLKQDVLLGCNGVALPANTKVATCAELTQALSLKQDVLLGCNGVALPANTKVATCAELTQALSLKQDVLLGCNGVALPANTKVATCIDLNSKADLVDGKVPVSQLPEQESTGLDCAAIGKLDVRPYRAGDSVLIHNDDGTCARLYAKPGIFTDVRVGMVTQYSSIFTESSSDIITTVQNVADSKATVRVTIMKPDAVVISEVISKPNGVTVTKVSDGVFDISNLGYGEKVLITNKMRFDVKGNYGFSATLTISEDGLFDYSTDDDYASTSVTVANASEGELTEDCPLAVVYGPEGTTKLPVYTNYSRANAVIILTDDVTPVALPTENVTTILAHLAVRSINVPGQSQAVFEYDNYSTYMMGYNAVLATPDGLGVTLTDTTINIPPPPAGLYAYGLIELKVGPNCRTQLLDVYIIRKSDLQPKRGVITVSPAPSGGSIEYAVEATDAIVDLYVVDKTTTNRRGGYGVFVRTATVTVPAGTAYNGIATLSGNISKYTSTGAITLTPNGTADAVTIAVSSTARPVDSIVDFYNCLNISITE